MEQLKVIRLESESKSFKWNNGLFAVYKKENNLIHLWKIKDGKLELIDGKFPNITVTGINNKGIIHTDLLIQKPSR